MQQSEFFTDTKCLVTLMDIKPKLNTEGEKRVRFDFQMGLTAKLLDSAPEVIKSAFYAVAKEDAYLNPAGIPIEYEGVIASFFSTVQTKSPSLELANCKLQKLEVKRPENKATLDDGDVKLKFHMNVPGSREAWNWAYSNFGMDICAVFEEMQPVFPTIKGETPTDGQMLLGDEIKKAEAQHDALTMPDENRKVVSKIKTKKKKK